MDGTHNIRGWRRAAYEIEAEVGKPKETSEQVRTHLVLRLARASFGATVLIVGIFLLVLPGPGLLVVAAGLAILARDVPFARRMYLRVHERIPKDHDGKIPVWMIVAGITISILLACGGMAFTFLR